MKLKIYAIVITFALAAMFACGGSSKSGNGGVTAAANKAGSFGYHGFGGMSATTSKKTTAGVRWNGLIPSAYAQTSSTVTMTGTYHGSCDQAPIQATGGTVYIPLLGMGTAMRPDNCVINGSSHDWNSSGAGAASTTTGEPAIGPGTLGQLVVYGMGDGTVSVFVNRAGLQVDTGIHCTISGTTATRCFDTVNTFALSDGDMVNYVLGYTAGDAPKNISAYISKS